MGWDCARVTIYTKKDKKFKKQTCSVLQNWKEYVTFLFQTYAVNEQLKMLQYSSVLINQSKRHMAQLVSNTKTEHKKMKTKSVSVFFLWWNTDTKIITAIAIFIKYTLGKSWNTIFLFITTKLFTILTMKQNQSFLYWNIFPAAQHDNTVLNSNGITDHCHRVFITQYLLQIF